MSISTLMAAPSEAREPPKSYTPPPQSPVDSSECSSNTEERMSFSSFKELSSSPLAQTFLESRTSSYARVTEHAVDSIDDFIDDIITPLPHQSQMPPRRRETSDTPESHLHCGCHCHSFKRWKHVTLDGKKASKSSGDLRKLAQEWDTDSLLTSQTPAQPTYVPGNAPFERLPLELLSQIINHFAIDLPPYGITPRNTDLMALLTTSTTIHAATLMTLYKHITIPHSIVFRKFLKHISQHTELGAIVRRLDFSHFNPRVAAATARERAGIKNLTEETLLQCLSLTPNLQEFLTVEHLDSDLSFAVLSKLFSGDFTRLKGLDLCASSSPKFRDAFSLALTQGPSVLPASLSITRLSLHECTILPPSVIPSLLSRLPNLALLDVAHTRVTDGIFDAIPRSAKLTHLNLSRCGGITGKAVIQFLRAHPAVQGSLVCLNLGADAKSQEMLAADDVEELLNVLNKQNNRQLRSLILKGSKMGSNHVDLLMPLVTHLEELGVGRHLNISDITKLWSTGSKTSNDNSQVTLRYLDLTDLSVAAMDFHSLFASACPVLNLASDPLEVIELSQEVLQVLRMVDKTCKQLGWVIKEAGRRAWLVRDWTSEAGGTRSLRHIDSGRRSWKLGASFWGMRKYPVAESEAGGMYGLYMFKR